MEPLEIRSDLTLTDEQTRHVAFHSFVNLINIILIELRRCEEDLLRPNRFLHVRESLLQVLDSLREDVRVEHLMGRIRELREHLRLQLELDAPEEHYVPRLLDVVDARLQEMVTRRTLGDQWIAYNCFEVRHNFELVFEVIGERGDPRFRVRFDREHSDGPPAYRLILELACDDQDMIRMPPVMQDVLRDLTANARKYTAPGGHISARLEETDHDLYLRVSDNGRGIPTDEIMSVIQYGVRGSNTNPREMKGGGFGLTKAYSVARRLDGRMWITSSTDGPDTGTTVEIRIPRRENPGVA